MSERAGIEYELKVTRLANETLGRYYNEQKARAEKAERELAEARATIEQADTTRREWEVRAAKSRKEADALRGERHDLTNEVMTLKSLLHVALRTTGQLPPGKDLPTDKTARTRLLNTLILDALPLLLDERYRTAHATGRAAGLREAAAKLAELRDEWEVMMGDGSVAHNCGKIAHGHVIALAPPAAETVSHTITATSADGAKASPYMCDAPAAEPRDEGES